MPDIIRSAHNLLIFTFDDAKQQFVACPIDKMRSGGVYYLVEPSKNRVCAGFYKRLTAEEYNDRFAAIPIRGNWTLFVFVTSHVYPSIKDVTLSWTAKRELFSLSESIDEGGVCIYEHKKELPEAHFHALSDKAAPTLIATNHLPKFFADIHRHLEEREISAFIDRLRSAVRTDASLEHWKKYKELYELYKTTGDKRLRNQLIDNVAINHGVSPKEVFIERLKSYKAEREGNRAEYFTVWAMLFSGRSHSRTAKMTAVDEIVTSLTNGSYSLTALPEAARNGYLHEIVQFFSGYDMNASPTLAR